MKRIPLIILLLAVIGGLIYYYTAGQPKEITLTGIVTTDDYIVNPQITGRLQKVCVKEGDTVKKGDLIAIIQPDQWQADVDYYQHAEQQAATQVAQAEADLRFMEQQTNHQILQAQANLEAAKAAVAQGQADLENARLTFVHEDEAFKRGVESVQAFDQARTAYDGSKAKLETLSKQAVAAQAAVDVAKSSLQQVAARRAAIDAAKHEVEAAGAQKEKAKVELDYTRLYAPTDGFVEKLVSRQGEVVSPAQAILTIVDPDNLWVRADVEETYIDRIHLGDIMTVRLSSGTLYQGTVFYRAVDADYATQRDISRTKRDIKTFEIRLRCANADRALALGMTAYVSLPLSAPATQPSSTTTRNLGP